MNRALRILPVAALLAMSVFGVAGTPAAAAGTCPPSPAPGSTVFGNVNVNTSVGSPPFPPCVLDHVTVMGNVTVGLGNQLILKNGANVTGTVSVGTGGTLTVQSGSTISGLVTLTDAVLTIQNSSLLHGMSGSVGGPATITIIASAISGPLTLSATGPAVATICGSQLNGAVQLSAFNTSGSKVGDPGGAGTGDPTDCAGNTITGSLTVNGAGGMEIEGNKIAGKNALSLNGVTGALAGNQITGTATCTSSFTPFFPVDADDTTPNTYNGANNGCPL